MSTLTNDNWLDSENNLTSPFSVVLPIGVPGKNIPSFPEVKTSIPSSTTKSSGRYSRTGLLSRPF